MRITIKDKDYELKITTKYMLELEDKLGFNPLNIFFRMENSQELPPLGQVLTIFHYCLLKFNHGISFNDTLDLYDDYMSEGGTLVSLLETIIKVFQEAGILGKETNEGNA